MKKYLFEVFGYKNQFAIVLIIYFV